MTVGETKTPLRNDKNRSAPFFLYQVECVRGNWSVREQKGSFAHLARNGHLSYLVPC